MNRKVMSLVVGVVFGLALTFLSPQDPSNPYVETPERGVPLPTANSLVQSLAQPLRVPASEPKGTGVLSAGCRQFHRRILELDLKGFTDLRFSEALFDLPLLAPQAFLKVLSESAETEDACGSMPGSHPLRGIHGAFAKSCRLASGASDFERDETKVGAVNWCFHLWQRYRLSLMAESTKHQPLASITDERLLVARLGVGLMSAREAGDYDDILRVVERLNQLKPGAGYDRFARKLEFEQVMETSSGDERAVRRAALADRLAKSGSEDAQALEIRALLAKDAGDTERMAAVARTLREIAPEKGAYYLAWSAYLSDSKERALEHLASITNPSPLSQFAVTQLTADADEAKTPFSPAGLDSGLKRQAPELPGETAQVSPAQSDSP